MKVAEVYEPLKGFYDLREFKLTKAEFSKFHSVQKYLFSVESKKENIKKNDPMLWEKVKQLSGEYQQALLSCEREVTL